MSAPSVIHVYLEGKKKWVVISNLASGVYERIYRVHLSRVFSWAMVVSTGANRC